MSRRLAVWIVILVAFIAVFIGGVLTAAETGASSASLPLESQGVRYVPKRLQDGNGPAVAVVPVTGTIVNGDSNPDGSSTGGDDLVRLIDEIAESGQFEGIILEMNTPGGAVLASAEVSDAVKRAQHDHHLKVVSWMRDVAASGGYYISAPADSIVAHPSTFTGSIGVILEYLSGEELADKIGVKPVVIKSGKLKDIGSPYRDITTEERAVLQSVIDESYDDFVKAVSEGRDIDEDTVRRIADGRIYTGRQGKENGLVDRLGARREAYDEMARLLDVEDDDGTELEVVSWSRSYSFFETLGAGAQPSLDLGAAVDLAGAALGGHGLSGVPLSARQGSPDLPTLEYRAVL